MTSGVAVVDHHEKGTRIDHAEVLAWYCAHDGTRCGGPSPARMEARWNQRQTAYEWGAALFGVAGLLCVIRPERLWEAMHRA
jgi:hypothetical protein